MTKAVAMVRTRSGAFEVWKNGSKVPGAEVLDVRNHHVTLGLGETILVLPIALVEYLNEAVCDVAAEAWNRAVLPVTPYLN